MATTEADIDAARAQNRAATAAQQQAAQAQAAQSAQQEREDSAERAEDDETQERAYGQDERDTTSRQNIMSYAWEANIKRTYDEFQDLSLTMARQMQNLVFQAAQNAISNANISTQMLLDNMNQASKAALRHADSMNAAVTEKFTATISANKP